MKRTNEIGENEIRVIGGDAVSRRRWPWWLWAAVTAVVAVGVVFFLSRTHRDGTAGAAAPETAEAMPVGDGLVWLTNSDASLPCATLDRDTVVDSIRLQILTPVNAVPELHVGPLDAADEGIVLAAMAADVRRDNGRIVGAYVCAGEPLSWGLSKKGYCAIIHDSLTLGKAENSPLFERATDEGGYFFRQYAAVAAGAAVHNNPENRSMRRALCMFGDRVCVVGTEERVLMDEFCVALEHLGVREAILLVGGTATAWWRDAEGQLHWLGKRWENPPKYSNYILFRAQ